MDCCIARSRFCNAFVESLIGLLRIELPKEVYERTGLLGQPIEDGGRKQVKTRYGKQSIDNLC